ncbi:hypothetical protein EJ06DRAFT_579276 [Trichodelitschia bisporula]|uniref:Uncharacterized protein n=1 Tax=Trichodelitschia bisporula TaxID=703511 RepID=A0A6G1I927_9PEZI|nr:hypothetical protein EJ06DRAFT_579276 [Trichodelitschia bisporula]
MPPSTAAPSRTRAAPSNTTTTTSTSIRRTLFSTNLRRPMAPPVSSTSTRKSRTAAAPATGTAPVKKKLSPEEEPAERDDKGNWRVDMPKVEPLIGEPEDEEEKAEDQSITMFRELIQVDDLPPEGMEEYIAALRSSRDRMFRSMEKDAWMFGREEPKPPSQG